LRGGSWWLLRKNIFNGLSSEDLKEGGGKSRKKSRLLFEKKVSSPKIAFHQLERTRGRNGEKDGKRLDHPFQIVMK